MFSNFRSTMKKFFVDTLGEDLSDISSGLSKGAKAAIACGAIVAVSAGATSLSNSANSTSDNAANRVGAPLGAGSANTGASQQVYK